ncbi:hypothetical protein B0H19DRAFT_1180055 [Mycena capillaripes]|nr:hypothetical protein B0H19DRAFT_1180055 [Mycena capillaripes]
MAAVPTPPPPQQPFNNPQQRQGTQPPFTVGIAAGAEDVKYQAKYKDLKRKVKEIEAVRRPAPASTPFSHLAVV